MKFKKQFSLPQATTGSFHDLSRTGIHVLSCTTDQTLLHAAMLVPFLLVSSDPPAQHPFTVREMAFVIAMLFCLKVHDGSSIADGSTVLCRMKIGKEVPCFFSSAAD